MKCSIINVHTYLTCSFRKYPAIFGVAAVIGCLALYSFSSMVPGFPILGAPALATAAASLLYVLSRSAFWNEGTSDSQLPVAAHSRAKRLIAGALAAAAVSLAVGFALTGAEPRADDISLESPLLVVGICILTGIYEELLFRGVLFGSLRLYYGESGSPSAHLLTRAVVVQALVFALAHVMGGIIRTMQQPDMIAILQIAVWIMGTFLFGIVMAKLLENTHRIAINCILHAIYDFVLFAPLAFAAGILRTEAITGSPADLAVFAIQALILCTALATFAIRSR